MEHHIAKVILTEFNWRWNKYLKREQTQQQFSRDFRKLLKQFILSKKKVKPFLEDLK